MYCQRRNRIISDFEQWITVLWSTTEDTRTRWQYCVQVHLYWPENVELRKTQTVLDPSTGSLARLPDRTLRKISSSSVSFRSSSLCSSCSTPMKLSWELSSASTDEETAEQVSIVAATGEHQAINASKIFVFDLRHRCCYDDRFECLATKRRANFTTHQVIDSSSSNILSDQTQAVTVKSS